MEVVLVFVVLEMGHRELRVTGQSLPIAVMRLVVVQTLAI